MIKILMYIFVIVIIFSTALYFWVVQGIIQQLSIITNDFMPYIPLEIRLVWSFIILGFGLALVLAFIQ